MDQMYRMCTPLTFSLLSSHCIYTELVCVSHRHVAMYDEFLDPHPHAPPSISLSLVLLVVMSIRGEGNKGRLPTSFAHIMPLRERLQIRQSHADAIYSREHVRCLLERPDVQWGRVC